MIPIDVGSIWDDLGSILLDLSSILDPLKGRFMSFDLFAPERANSLEEEPTSEKPIKT